MNNTKTKLYVAIGGVLAGLIVLYILSSSVIPKLLVTRSGATVVGKVDLGSSYFLAGKIMAKADGKDKCIVNVFVRDASNVGVVGRVVKLSGASNIVPEQAVTDAIGKAQFEITSTIEGQFPLSATVDGAPMIGKNVTVIFRNQFAAGLIRFDSLIGKNHHFSWQYIDTIAQEYIKLYFM